MKHYILYLLGMLFSFSSALADTNPTEVIAAVLVDEARGEGYNGMLAVMNVINNRAGGVPEKRLGVVMKPWQFSCLNAVTTGKQSLSSFVEKAKTRRAWWTAYRIAEASILIDITGGADHYHATYVKPKWARKDKITTQIKTHIFYKL